jgi:hypothetical protein
MQQPAPNRLGLGLRPPVPSFGQGPSISALAQQQQMLQLQQFPGQPPKAISLFVGSISGGIGDAFLNQLLGVSESFVDFPNRISLAVGLWPHETLKTTDYTCKQTPRVWIL